MHCNFLNKLTRKIHAEQCLALYSRWWTQQMHACFQLGLSAVQTSEPTSKTWGDRHACFAVKCNLSYPASYRDSCIRILYVSYRREMYRCRPLKNEWEILLLTQSPVLLISSGTLFMVKLHEQLKYFVNDKVSSDPAWQGLRIYLSGHEVRQELKYSKRWYMYIEL